MDSREILKFKWKKWKIGQIRWMHRRIGFVGSIARSGSDRLARGFGRGWLGCCSGVARLRARLLDRQQDVGMEDDREFVFERSRLFLGRVRKKNKKENPHIEGK